jgi:2-polyprenyl-3-methyl-5-hydroxy-6-metoxy-1,4-benzoquinol methylase
MEAVALSRVQKRGVASPWEEVNACPLCAARQEEELLTVPATDGEEFYRLVRCGQCGLGYQNPRPTPASISRFYPVDYECYQPRSAKRTPGLIGKLRSNLERIVLAYYYGVPPLLKSPLSRCLAIAAGPWFRPSQTSLGAIPYTGEGRLLDFGCGAGWYAHRMRMRGWNVTGMDFSIHAARQTSHRFGIPVLLGTFPHPQVPPQSFDVITMGQVLEHVHEPQRVVQAAAEALRPGGLLVISVPNLDSWGYRFFGSAWSPLDLPRHLIHFTPDSLRRMVEQAGLEITYLKALGHTRWMGRTLEAALRRHPGGIGKALLACCQRSRILTSLLTRCCTWAGKADCIVLMARRRVTSTSMAA